jgi:hypothetical protein
MGVYLTIPSMRPWLACLALIAPPPLFAAVVEAPAFERAAPTLAAPAFGAAPLGAAVLAPSLSAPSSFSPSASLSAPAAALAPLPAVAAAAPAAAPAATAFSAAASDGPAVAGAASAPAPALSAAGIPAASARAAAPALRSARPTAEPELTAAARAADGAVFDGSRAAAPAHERDGWTLGSFESAAGGAVGYKARLAAPERGARVYSGGLALNESFDPLFATPRESAPSQFFLWTRGHPPTDWTPTAVVIDADARDLARMIVAASRRSGSKKVELALHSFGTLVFQRLIQLRGDPEVDAALKLLSGSRVVLLNATTHYDGSEERAGADFARMGDATRTFIDWLNAMDSAVAAWKKAVAFNPWLAPADLLWSGLWDFQRGQLMSMASREAAAMMRQDLAAPWPAHNDIREGFLKDLARDSQDPGWQESLLRRSSDMFRLEFTPEDVAYIRRLGIRLDLVHATGDQLLNWQSARILFERLGIEAPDAAPSAGAVLTDRDGKFRATLVDGDHYFPLKQPEKLAKVLDP